MVTVPVGMPLPVGSVSVPVMVSGAPAAGVVGLGVPVIATGVGAGCTDIRHTAQAQV